MKQILIIIFFWVYIFFCIKNFSRDIGLFRQDSMVKYGSKDAYGQAGIIRANPKRPFCVDEHIEQWLPTVIEFYADYCSSCRELNNYLRNFVKLRPDVAVRQIKLSNEWNTSVAWENYKLNIRSIPHVLIYGHDGKLIVQDNGNKKDGYDFIYKWMNDEKKKDWEKNRKN